MVEGPDGSIEREYDLEVDDSVADAGIGTSTGLLGGPRGSVFSLCCGALVGELLQGKVLSRGCVGEE